MKSSDKIYTQLIAEFDTLHNTYIPLERLQSAAQGVSSDMIAYLESPEGKRAFVNAVARLVSEHLITPVGRPATAHGLHLKYRVNKKSKDKDNELLMQIVKSIAPPANVDYYIKNPRDFLLDRDIIDVISSFLRLEKKGLVTVNERSYELFGDEKFLRGNGNKGSRGETVLKRLGLTCADIACEETLEPFFSFQKKDFHSRAARSIYIIENKDTFWSFKREIMDRISAIKVGMLIYGEGKKIISSFQFIREYDIDPQKDEVYYFGDLDPEGINIYGLLVDEYPQYKIAPFCEGYQAVLEIGLSGKLIKTPRRQKINEIHLARFIQFFDNSTAEKIKRHIEGGFYIPQEALSAAKMREIFGR